MMRFLVGMINIILSLCLMTVANSFIHQFVIFTNPYRTGRNCPHGRLPCAARGKWDSLIDEDDDFQFHGRLPVLPDMKYTARNIRRQREIFDHIRKVGGNDLIHDVYARDPEEETFWYVGKVARVSDVSLRLAIARLWPMIVEHSARLRPQELYPQWSKLELWVAPGDSELDVAYCRPHIQFLQMFPETGEIANRVRNVEVGFQGEVYESGEEGFRTVRTADGKPIKPEILSSVDQRQPTDSELDEMMETLNSQLSQQTDDTIL